ncbi:MAG: energy transducer TonB [Candidatus Competibacteraceae bacterium]|nr:energy transducer TonB [Candidatus Competibacteraceae bacterium]
MMKIWSIGIALLITIQASGQEYPDSVFRNEVDKYYKGGIGAWERYTTQKSKIKEENLEDTRKRGTVVLGFTLMSNGEIDNVEFLNHVSEDVDEDAFQLLKKSADQWKPKLVDNKPVSVWIEVSFHYLPFTRADLKPMKEKIPELYQNKKYDEIHHILDAVIRNQPYDADAIYGRGIIYHEQGKTIDACMTWQRAAHIGHIESDEFHKKHCK